MQQNHNIFYVYRHTFANGYIYIGKGKNERAYKTSERNKFYNNILKKYGKPLIEILFNNLAEKESFKVEIEQISIHKTNGFKLLNMTNGGEGVSGFKHSELSKAKMKINTSFRNPEVRKKISESRKGKPSGRKGFIMSEEQKNKISKNRKGKNIGSSHHMYGKRGEDSIHFGRNRNNNIYTFYHEKYGKETCNIYDLCKKYNLLNPKIYMVANNQRASHNGWKLEGSTYEKKKKPPLTKEHIEKLRNAKLGKPSKRRDINNYEFINIETKEKIICTKLEFINTYGGNMSNINNMVNLNSDRLGCMGWIYEKKINLLKRK